MNRYSILTAEQQQIVARALPYGLAVARKHARFYGPRFDFESAVALRLCEQIAKFDASRSELKSWASWQARTACGELMCVESPQRSRRKYFRKTRIYSLDSLFGPNGEPLAARIAARPGEEADPEEEFSLLRGLDTRARTVVWRSIVEDEPIRMIARSLGVSESVISKLRKSAIKFLRQRAIA